MRPSRSATVYMPGTCGELVQGVSGGSHFLVSCPVDLFCRVTVELTEDGLISVPEDSPKAGAALEAAREFFAARGAAQGTGSRLGARLRLDSPLPRSKGMGSSTADVAGAIYALAQALGYHVEPLEVAGLAVAIEPTDSSLFPNLAFFDHRVGSVYEDLGAPPPAEILVLDCGGEVDTLAYNAFDRAGLLRELEPVAAEALALVREGITRRDLRLVGQGATMSARAHQRVMPKAPLDGAIALGTRTGAAGVCVGHSGTVIGVLFHAGQLDSDRRALATLFRTMLPEVQVLGWCNLIGGGFYARRLGAGSGEIDFRTLAGAPGQYADSGAEVAES